MEKVFFQNCHFSAESLKSPKKFDNNIDPWAFVIRTCKMRAPTDLPTYKCRVNMWFRKPLNYLSLVSEILFDFGRLDFCKHNSDSMCKMRLGCVCNLSERCMSGRGVQLKTPSFQRPLFL
jgi:hypothetical protein